MRQVRKICFTFVPSVQEISDYAGDNLYYCGLEDARASVHALKENVMNDFYENKDKSDPHFGEPRFVKVDDRQSKGYYGSFPELTFNVIVTLGSSGMGLAVYRLLSLWIKAKNGRKIHVKLPNGLVVDTTQMSREEFSAFLAEVYAVYSERENPKRLQKHIKDKHVPVVSDEEGRKIVAELAEAVEKKSEELRERKQHEAK